MRLSLELQRREALAIRDYEIEFYVLISWIYSGRGQKRVRASDTDTHAVAKRLHANEKRSFVRYDRAQLQPS